MVDLNFEKIIKNQKLKIAQITPYYFPSLGGVETVVKYISEEMVKRGHDVLVLSTKRDHKGELKNIPNFEEINGVKVYRFSNLINLGHMSLFPGFIKILTEKSINILHMHSIRHPHTIIGTFIARKKKICSILHGHAHFSTSPYLKLKLYNIFDRIIFPSIYNRISTFIAITKTEKYEYIKRGIPENKIKIIPNGTKTKCFGKINIDSFIKKYQLHDRKIILYLGDFKRIDLLVKSLPKIRNEINNVTLLLVGNDHGKFSYYEKLAKNLNVLKNIQWIGRVSEYEKKQALASMHFLILPSDYEAFGLVLIEAMAAGKPVIATSSPGPIDIIDDGKTGFLIRKDSIEDIVRYSILLLKNKNIATKMGKQAKLTVKLKYSMSSVIDQIETLYYELISQ